MNTLKITIPILLVIIIGILLSHAAKPKIAPRPTCNTDTKTCPDGSSVSRTGSQCEFTTCPETIATTTQQKNKGILMGHVTIGPVCPVEYKDNPCKPTPEMYAAAEIFVYTSNKKTLIKKIIPDQNGNFSVELPIGSYFVDMTHQNVGGTTGVPKVVDIFSNKSTMLTINVDTGLR